MPATPQPMSIYHPDAATPRRVETVKARSNYVPPVKPSKTWAEMARDEGHAKRHPKLARDDEAPGPKPRKTSIAHAARLTLAERPATLHEMAQRMGLTRYEASNVLGSLKRAEMASMCAITKVWHITDKGRNALRDVDPPAKASDEVKKAPTVAKRIRAYLKANGESTNAEIGVALNLGCTTVCRSLSRQKQQGKVEHGSGPARWKLTERGMNS